jgi:inner membrane protease subunit 1
MFGSLAWAVDRYALHLTTTEGPSMAPTLAEAGDVVLVDKLSPRFAGWAPIRRGDIVVADSSYRASYTVCKRVVALGGDVVVPPRGRGARVAVPPGHVWLEGDNAHDSTDSRAYGPVPAALVRGRVLARVWPPRAATFFSADEPRPRANGARLAELAADADIVRAATAAAAARAERAIKARALRAERDAAARAAALAATAGDAAAREAVAEIAAAALAAELAR